MSAADLLGGLEELITTTVEPAAAAVDAAGSFPRATIDALAAAGFLGLTSAPEVGGAGGTLADAATVVRRLAAACGSTGMVMCMHYSATAIIEAQGPESVRRDIAAGRHLSTLAFSESGSRSHFWAPLSTATPDATGDTVTIDASKSWITSAGEADSYVWTSRPAGADGPATLWLVPSDAAGLEVTAAFDGLGLRGNASSPVRATGVQLPVSARLGADGGGLDIALGIALPTFQILNASGCLGMADAMVAKAIAHVTTARLEHLDQHLADQPVTRLRVATMKGIADQADTLVADAIVALGTGRADAPLRMLQSKAAGAEAALAVGDLAMRLGGGAAFRRDIGIERHFRDARASAVMAPTTDALSEFIGRALCGLELFG